MRTPKLASGLLMKQGDKLVFVSRRDRSKFVDDISFDRRRQRSKASALSAGKKLYVELFVVDGVLLRASGASIWRGPGYSSRAATRIWRSLRTARLVIGRWAGSHRTQSV